MNNTKRVFAGIWCLKFVGDYDYPFLYPSLVCNSDNQLFSLETGGGLHRYDIQQDSVELVANIGEGTSGDLTFYKGNLIF